MFIDIKKRKTFKYKTLIDPKETNKNKNNGCF